MSPAGLSAALALCLLPGWGRAPAAVPRPFEPLQTRSADGVPSFFHPEEGQSADEVSSSPLEPAELPPDATEVGPRVALGVYPAVEGSVGPPNTVSWRLNGYLSFTVKDRFSVFAGYGEDWGPHVDSEIYTLGWGGVREVPAVVPQRGFHGKFIRYRRWHGDQHGLHYGLSLGTESGFGPFGVVLEVGAARSDRNHWLAVAQFSVKLGIPILIPLGG